MMLNVVWMMTAAVMGFMIGRVSMYGQAEPEPAQEAGGEQGAAAEEKKTFRLRRRKHRMQEEQKIWTVGSPVSGRVTAQREGELPTIVVSPDSDRLYAPADGKITRLFPMGNALLFTTEFGTELYIQAGEVSDELLVRHYRPRVVQNEVVGKGKLLLEFDRKGLEAEGVSAEVSVCVESCFYGSGVKIAAGERIKAGEDILQVCESALEGELIHA